MGRGRIENVNIHYWGLGREKKRDMDKNTKSLISQFSYKGGQTTDAGSIL